MRRFKINPKKRMVKVSKYASCITGTTAKLREGDILSVYDLLHGVMLPSGNDAATCLSEHFAVIIKEDREKQAINSKNPRLASMNENGEWEFNPLIYGNSGVNNNKGMKSRNLVKLFVEEMNKTAKMLGMENTSFSNPHGMCVLGNSSTISDIGIISSQAMKINLIRHIVKKKKYLCEGEGGDGTKRQYKWTNTNKMLGKDTFYNGLKTGTTKSAGACLVGNYETECLNLIIVVLNSSSDANRWDDTNKLKDWAIDRLNSVEEYLESLNTSSKLEEADTTDS